MHDASIDTVENAHRRDGFRAFTSEHDDAQRHRSLTRDIRRRRNLAGGRERARNDITENNPRVRKLGRRVDEIAHRDADRRVFVALGVALERSNARARPSKATTDGILGQKARRASSSLARRRWRDHSRDDRGTRERHCTTRARLHNARARE